MTRFLTRFVPAALVLGLVSCAQPVALPAINKPATERKKEVPSVQRSERGKVSSISVTEVFAHQQAGDSIIYDARPSYLFKQGHIPGAISMPRSICDEVIAVRKPELKAARDQKKTIIVYCTGFLCSDARTVANHLAKSGYSSSVFSGGWDSWKSAELPTE